MNPYRVSILAAGGGARFGSRSVEGHKALFRIGKLAVISHIVDHFPKEIPVVLALGHNATLVRQYVGIMHPERTFIYVESKNYGPGYGPAYSLELCREHLQVPFYSFACDTLVGDFVHDETANWVGFCDIPPGQAERYCTVRINELTDAVEEYFDKRQDGTNKAWIGLAFVRDFTTFWEAIRCNTERVNNERQLAPALCALPGLKGKQFQEWYDTGNEEGLQQAKKRFQSQDPLGKTGEEIYFRGKSVVKYFYDPDAVTARVKRAHILGDVVPSIETHSANFYRYTIAEGLDLTRSEEPHRHIEALLEFAQSSLWRDVTLTREEQGAFFAACTRFYRDKTHARLDQLYAQEQILDAACSINGMDVPPIRDVLESIDWTWLCDGWPSTYHGDLNLSNVIIMTEGSFKLIDHRDNFAGIAAYGDRYYDLAKLYQSFLWPHASVREEKFYLDCRQEENAVKVGIDVPAALGDSRVIAEAWAAAHSYDVQKIKILAALSLLNSAPLHEAKLGRHLYYLGRHALSQLL